MFGVAVVFGVLLSVVLLAADSKRRTGKITYWRVLIAVGITFVGAGSLAGQEHLRSNIPYDAGDFLARYAGMLAFLWFVIVRPKKKSSDSQPSEARSPSANNTGLTTSVSGDNSNGRPKSKSSADEGENQIAGKDNPVEQQDKTITISTPPHWGSKLRFLGLPLMILGLILLHDVTYDAFKSYYSRYPFDLISLFFNLLTAWPIILVYIGYFNCVGKWGYTNRIVIDKNRAVFYLLRFIGREAETVVMDSIVEIKRNRIIGKAGEKTEKVYVLRRYLTEDVRDRLLHVNTMPRK